MPNDLGSYCFTPGTEYGLLYWSQWSEAVSRFPGFHREIIRLVGSWHDPNSVWNISAGTGRCCVIPTNYIISGFEVSW